MNRLLAANLSVRLGGVDVLFDASVDLAPGTVTVIVGPNGAGKSTLLACLAGLRTPDRGRVQWGETPLAALPLRRRAQVIAVLPQVAEIAWAVDVRTLVGLGRIPHLAGFGPGHVDAAAVEAAIVATGIAGFAGRDVTTLSGGERARALIARALAGTPEWLLADEPLTGLDPGYQIDIVDVLRRFAAAEGRGVVVTLHDLGMAARLADRMVMLAGGKVLATGTPAEVLTAANLALAYGVDAVVTANRGRIAIDVIGRRR